MMYLNKVKRKIRRKNKIKNVINNKFHNNKLLINQNKIQN
jgi:hypothetical protein